MSSFHSRKYAFFNIDDNNMLLTIYGCNSNVIETLDHGPSFSLKSLLDEMPMQHFNTDEFISDSVRSKYYSSGEFSK